jgi:hypothetical protein
MERLSNTLRNGTATLLGSGLNHRHLTQEARARLAADVVTGVRPFVPSGEQACVIFNIPRYLLTKQLKTQRNGGKSINGDKVPMAGTSLGMNGNDMSVKVNGWPVETLATVFAKMAHKMGTDKLLRILTTIERANAKTKAAVE